MARFSANSYSPKINGATGLCPPIRSAVVAVVYTSPTAGGAGEDDGCFADAAERDAFIENHAELIIDMAALNTSYDLLRADLALVRTAIIGLNTAFEVTGLQTAS